MFFVFLLLDLALVCVHEVKFLGPRPLSLEKMLVGRATWALDLVLVYFNE